MPLFHWVFCPQENDGGRPHPQYHCILKMRIFKNENVHLSLRWSQIVAAFWNVFRFHHSEAKRCAKISTFETVFQSLRFHRSFYFSVVNMQKRKKVSFLNTNEHYITMARFLPFEFSNAWLTVHMTTTSLNRISENVTTQRTEISVVNQAFVVRRNCVSWHWTGVTRSVF